jgi:hypothetical protein
LGEYLSGKICLPGLDQGVYVTQPELGAALIGLQRYPEVMGRHPRLTHLCRKHAQVVVGIRVSRLEFKDRAVQPFGFLPPAGLMVGDSQQQRLFCVQRHGLRS